MAWFRVDDQAAFHAKVLKAGNEAFGAFCRAGAWSQGHGTNGWIPRAVALTIAPARIWKRLAEATVYEDGPGLVVETSDGWQIHDFLDWNPSAEELRTDRDAVREARRRAGMLGGLRSGEARRAKQNGRNGEANSKQSRSKTEANDEAKTKQNEAPYPYPIQEFTHTPPPTPPTADADEAELPSKTQIRPVVTAQPRAMDEAILDQETRQILDAIRSYDVLRVAATPELASRIGGRQMARGTPIRVILEAIDQCARTAESQAAVGAPWDAPRIADQLMRYCERAAVDWKARPPEARARPRTGRTDGLPPVQPLAKPGQHDWRTEADAKRAEKLAKYMNDELPPEVAAAFGGGT